VPKLRSVKQIQAIQYGITLLISKENGERGEKEEGKEKRGGRREEGRERMEEKRGERAR
jgi:hypothetical protein